MSGLVGYPNAGKSTLISVISAAKPKIANYPFTTLTPNLGVVALSGDRSFVVADVPGLIEGAHEGHGLGHQFLRHIERTKVLIHLVDISSESGRDPVEDFDTIRRELELYNPEMLAKPQLVAANKIDAVDDPTRVTALEKRAKKLKLKFFEISAVTGQGTKELIEAAWPIIAKGRELDAKAIELEIWTSEDDEARARRRITTRRSWRRSVAGHGRRRPTQGRRRRRQSRATESALKVKKAKRRR